jgi:hypothetical protein
MKVKDLIELLSSCDPEALILDQCEMGYCEPNCLIMDIACLDCQPNSDYYGGSHLLRDRRDIMLTYDFYSEEQKKVMRDSLEVVCVYLKEDPYLQSS